MKYKIISETKTHDIVEFDYFKKRKLPSPLKIKKTVGPYKSIVGEDRLWNIKKYKLIPQSNNLEKIFAIELMEDATNKKIKEVRIGYYIIGKKGRLKNKWAWGQFCPFFPQKDLKKALKIIKEDFL